MSERNDPFAEPRDAEFSGLERGLARRLRLDLLGLPLVERGDIEDLRRAAQKAWKPSRRHC